MSETRVTTGRRLVAEADVYPNVRDEIVPAPVADELLRALQKATLSYAHIGEAHWPSWMDGALAAIANATKGKP